MARGLLIAALLLLAPPARAQPSALDDARLGASAGELRQLLEQAERARLPSQLLADKVNEGLAKGVPPARIVGVVRALAGALGQARAELTPFAPSPPPALLKAVVETRAAGVPARDVDVVLQAGGRERALQVLTDLAQRGYPTGQSARLVGGMASRAGQLDKLVGQAERLRAIDGATTADTLDALGRANAQGLGLDHAEQLLHRGQSGDGSGGDNGNGNGGNDNGRGPNRETSGARGPKAGGVAAGNNGNGKGNGNGNGNNGNGNGNGNGNNGNGNGNGDSIRGNAVRSGAVRSGGDGVRGGHR